MEEEFLKKLYRYAEIITLFRQMVERLRVGDDTSKRLWKNCEDAVADMCRDCAYTQYPEAESLWELVRHVREKERDNIVRADIIENAILPIMEQWVQSLGSIAQEEGGYLLESTACGFLTMKSLRTGKYLHSNNNPMEEARKQIEFFYTPTVDEYAVMGCGLGYHVYQLYQVSRGSVKIRLYERDAHVVDIARKYGVLDWVPEDVLSVCTKDSVYAFLQDVDQNSMLAGAYMHLPSLEEIPDEVERTAMLQAWGEQFTEKNFHRDFLINFWRNVHADAAPVQKFPAEMIKEEAVVVAAGPSLDDFMDMLREWQGKKTIVAVGTVFAKLTEAGIRPDLVVVADPQERTIRQIEGLEEESVPMLLDSAAYWGFARRYKGKKYLAFTLQAQEIYEYARKKDIELWPSGGTVTALAVEAVTRFRARKIYLAGVDLAYPEGKTHALGTADRKQGTVNGLLTTAGVAGKTVYTTYHFLGYRQWLEEHIATHPEVMWYNLSTVGARLAGTREIGEQVIAGAFEPEKARDKISVIIPCYNVEPYIEECADSLLAQSIGREQLELVFVDDASTDGTYQILERLAAENQDCVKLFRMEKNSRQGAARNLGLREASGGYIGFVDADDYVDREMYELLYNALQNTDADVAICGRAEEDGRGKPGYTGPALGGVLDLTKCKNINIELNERASSGIVQRLYKRSVLEQASVRFPEQLTYEDNYFSYISNYYLKKAAMVKLPLYHYRIREDSTVQKRNSPHQLDRLQIETMKLDELKRRGLYGKHREEIEVLFMELYFSITVKNLFVRFDEIPEGILRQMQETVKKQIPNWRKNRLLDTYKGGSVKKICELADHPFVRGDKEELAGALRGLNL